MNDFETYENDIVEKDNYSLAVIIIAAFMAVIGIYTIYSIFTSGIEWGFDIDWNCFKSPLFPILAVIGFFLQFFNWQHTSSETWIGTKKQGDSDYKWEKSNDIMDTMFGSFVIPLLMHLLVIPCLYGAAMWYVIMGLVHVLGKASPFIISALVCGIVFCFYLWSKKAEGNRYRVAILIALTLVEGIILGGTAYYMNNHENISWFSGSSNSSSGYESIGICVITGDGVNLRKGPGTEFDKVGVMVSSGEQYPLLGEENGWCRILYNDEPAWISDKFCHNTYKAAFDDGGEEDLGCWTGDEGMEEGMSQEEIVGQDMTDNSAYGTAKPEEIVSAVDVKEIATVDGETNSLIVDSEDESQRTEQLKNMALASEDNNIYTATEVAAEFPGGTAALMKWLSQNIRYPETAQRNNVQGRVVVKFVVDKDGSIHDATVTKGVDKDLDKEALRVVSNMPKWKAGENSGRKVKSYYNLPITFRLQ